jgi:hypothetical protein
MPFEQLDYLELVREANEHRENPDWPSADYDGDGEKDLAYLGAVQREAQFGPLEWIPVAGSDSAIEITNNFRAAQLVRVQVPQLEGLDTYGSEFGGKVTIHRLVADQLLGFFQAVEDAGLKGLLKSWGGSFVPRRIRGRDSLSNHAYGVAFDLNMQWNGLGRTPALAKDPGTVRPLVPIASRFGLYWGGHYNSRRDGMHFEFVEVIQ